MKKLTIFLVVVLCSFLMGCSTDAQTISLDGPTKESILAYSEAKTDSLMTSLNNNDYAVFSQDFDDAMLKAMSQDAFDKLKQHTDDKLGAYISRQVKNVIQSGDFYRVNYEVVFEKDAAVKMGVVFRIAEPHQVSGLWFDK